MTPAADAAAASGTSLELWIRALALYVPIVAIVVGSVVRRPGRRQRKAALLACIWNVPALVAVHHFAAQQGWWTIQSSGGVTLLGMPIELLAGWMLLWGAVPVLVMPYVPLPIVALGAYALDLIAMPAFEPTVHLGPSWALGDAVAIALCLLPAQLYVSWMRDDTHLAARATLQVICMAVLTMWLLPHALFQYTGVHDGWRVLFAYEPRQLSIALQLVALAALPGLSAVQEFVTRGRGTPVPYDSPRRLVTSGIYAYIANPMQLSAGLTLAAWGIVLHNWWIAAASAMTLIYGTGLAAWDEGRDLDARFGAPWRRYRDAVGNWLPRWHPYVPPDRDERYEPRLYVAFTCGQCSEIGAWLMRQRPRGLRIEPAEQHPTRDLWRMTYDPRDGSADAEGVAAFARALEHINLAWALMGMCLRLPVVRPCVQLIVDATGGGPRRIQRGSGSGTGSETGAYCPR